jgi:ArsR family transcriptional regulator, arsenate/arsenite/antimonite-responsive transcriptional repressor
MLLGRRGEMNVGELCARLGVPQPTARHHLGLLRMARLVHPRRQGKGFAPEPSW